MTAAATVATPPIPYRPPGSAGVRLDRWKVVLAAVIGLAVVIATANVVLYVKRPPAAQAACTAGKPCVGPPPTVGELLGKKWVSPDLGYSFEYEGNRFTETDDTGSGVTLTAGVGINGHDAGVVIRVNGQPAGEQSLADLVGAEHDSLAEIVVGLTPDNQSPNQMIAPGLGFVRGIGGAYSGTLDSANGPGPPANVAIMGATDGTVNTVMSILIYGENLSDKDINAIRSTAGLSVDTFRWK